MCLLQTKRNALDRAWNIVPGIPRILPTSNPVPKWMLASVCVFCKRLVVTSFIKMLVVTHFHSGNTQIMLISAKCCIVSLSRGWVWMFQFSAASFVLHLQTHKRIKIEKTKTKKERHLWLKVKQCSTLMLMLLHESVQDWTQQAICKQIKCFYREHGTVSLSD